MGQSLNGGHMKPEINISKKKNQGTFWVRQCRVWPWPSAAAQSWGSSDTGRRCTGCKCTCSAAGRGWRDTRETHQHVFITPVGKARPQTFKRSSKVTANLRRRRNKEDRLPQRVAALVQWFFFYISGTSSFTLYINASYPILLRIPNEVWP